MQQLFGRPELEGLDGELIVGEPTARDVFRATTSGVMSVDGEPDVTFNVFDVWDMEAAPFHDRVAVIRQRVLHLAVHELAGRLFIVTQHKVASLADVDGLFAEALGAGYEGLVLRNTLSTYKYGRSTIGEAGLLKIKPFKDAEAVVIGTVELMRNENEAFTNELGRTARSYSKEGKRAGGMLGALVCRTPEGVEFEIGTGFDGGERSDIWTWRDKVIGRVVKYKYLAVGGYDKPRSAVFLGWRDGRDM